MIYFIAQDVCNKLKLRNSLQVFQRHGLVEGRDYLRFSQKMNTEMFKTLLDKNLIDKHSTLAFILTTSGVIELLFKSKSLESDDDSGSEMQISATKIKDELMSSPSYKVYKSVSYNIIKKIISGMTHNKLEKFYNDEAFAMKYIHDITGTPSEEMDEAIRTVRSFANCSIKDEADVKEFNPAILVKTFKNFSV